MLWPTIAVLVWLYGVVLALALALAYTAPFSLTAWDLCALIVQIVLVTLAALCWRELRALRRAATQTVPIQRQRDDVPS